MIAVIYGTRNGTQDSIAWWLCNSMTKNIEAIDDLVRRILIHLRESRVVISFVMKT